MRLNLTLAVLSFAALAATAPLPIHSHNDYTRNVPLMDALDNSVTSIEADLWLKDGQLYVAHTEGDINKSITFTSLYVQPILDIIEGRKASPIKLSVENPLQLLIDFKSDGNASYGPILAALEPLRSAGHLTTFKDGVLKQGAVTAIGSGNTPLAKVLAASPRDLFFDAPLATLTSTPPAPGVDWSKELSPLASVDFGSVNGVLGTIYTGIFGTVTSDVHDKIVKQIQEAHAKGVKTRYWDAPNKEKLYIELLHDGSDWLNTDHLTTVRNIVLANS
ncbi:hypothetical protein DL96DRAFT_1629577 [Flagelloscypha sp. PMI_526]|nr:hypothetical protein DL96DRAFT_1629577 [Flagelloscypha sp. PMI_526]